MYSHVSFTQARTHDYCENHNPKSSKIALIQNLTIHKLDATKFAL